MIQKYFCWNDVQTQAQVFSEILQLNNICKHDSHEYEKITKYMKINENEKIMVSLKFNKKDWHRQ